MKKVIFTVILFAVTIVVIAIITLSILSALFGPSIEVNNNKITIKYYQKIFGYLFFAFFFLVCIFLIIKEIVERIINKVIQKKEVSKPIDFGTIIFISILPFFMLFSSYYKETHIDLITKEIKIEEKFLFSKNIMHYCLFDDICGIYREFEESECGGYYSYFIKTKSSTISIERKTAILLLQYTGISIHRKY